MSLTVRLYNLNNTNPYTVRYLSGSTNPYPEYDDTHFPNFVGSGLTASEINVSGLTFNTEYWFKVTDNVTGRYYVKNIFLNDSKSFSCYDTLCFDTSVQCCICTNVQINNSNGFSVTVSFKDCCAVSHTITVPALSTSPTKCLCTDTLNLFGVSGISVINLGPCTNPIC